MFTDGTRFDQSHYLQSLGNTFSIHPLSCRTPVILLTSVGTSTEGYLGRIAVGEHDVTLKRATGADEGSYTVRDAEGNIQTKLCLNVLSERITPSVSVPLVVTHLRPFQRAKTFVCSSRSTNILWVKKPWPFFYFYFFCPRPPELWGGTVRQTAEDQPNTQQLPSPPLLHPQQCPHWTSALG